MPLHCKPLRALTVTVEVPEEPLLMLSDVGDVAIEKSGLVTCTVIVVLMNGGGIFSCYG